MQPVDAHVHLVGNGATGSGCQLHPYGWYRWLGRFLCRHIGLAPDAFTQPDFDERYVTHLCQLIRQSSLGRVLLLACDHVYRADGTRTDEGLFYVPNDYVLNLARQFPEFLPAVSIHPARPDALDELDRCVAAGAVVMKCLPNCQNINCNDPRYRPFWERMAAHRLPLLAHTGGEHTLPQINPAYADPRILTLPLECGVTCIAAHCAGRALFDREYFHVFTDMTRRYPNLYGDLSGFNIPFRARLYRHCLRPPLTDRLLHGSDFPVPTMPLWPWLWGLLSWRAYRHCARIPNPLERDYQIKRALGFPDIVFSRILQLLPTRTRGVSPTPPATT